MNIRKFIGITEFYLFCFYCLKVFIWYQTAKKYMMANRSFFLIAIWSPQSHPVLFDLLSKAETVFKCEGHIVPAKDHVGIIFMTSLLISTYGWHLMRCEQRGPLCTPASLDVFSRQLSCAFSLCIHDFILLNMYIIYLFSHTVI